MTPLTSRPARRAASARRPASSGGQPQRGKPTQTSISTSRTPPAVAAAMVSSESTATVMRAPASPSTPRRRASSTSLASSRSSPRPAAAMPSISRMVAQQNPWWPASANRRARAVDLNAFTWGRRRRPGQAADMTSRLWSKASRSTTRAGVGRSRASTAPPYATRPLPPGSGAVGGWTGPLPFRRHAPVAESGRRAGFRSLWAQARVGSIPTWCTAVCRWRRRRPPARR